MCRCAPYEPDQQIAKEGGAGRPGRRPGGPAEVLASVQSQGLHPGPTVRLPGAEGVLQDRLPRRRGHPGRHARPAPGHRAEEDPALHRPAEGLPALSRGGCCETPTSNGCWTRRWRAAVLGRGGSAAGGFGGRPWTAVASKPITSAITSCGIGPRAEHAGKPPRTSVFRSWPRSAIVPAT